MSDDSFHSKSPNPVYTTGSKLPTLHSYEPAEYESIPGEGLPRRRIGVETVATECKMGPEYSNIWSMFEYAAKRYADNDCFGKRVPAAKGPFQWMKYSEVYEAAKSAGSGLRALGLQPGDCVGLYAPNSEEWAFTSLGAYSQSITVVPLYDTLGDDAVRYEIEHAELKVILCAQKNLHAVAAVKDKIPSLKTIVQVEKLEGSDAHADALIGAGITMTDFDTMLFKGNETLTPPTIPEPDSIAVIMYTSGTTGDPKGVCLSHRGVTVGASWGGGIDLRQETYLSYLPLAHIFETMIEHAILCRGGRVGFYSGNIKLVLEDVAALQPTFFVGVPRVFQRVYDKVMGTIESKPAVVRALFGYAMKLEYSAAKNGRSGSCLSFLFRSVRKALGGKVRMILSGAAPLPAHVHEFLVSTMGAEVFEGYGMTENCANATLPLPGEYRSGRVGPPMPTQDVKLVDVPEMNYTSASVPPCGEILTKGAVNFVRYHKNPDASAEVLRQDGWLHTGDIGRWNSDGTLSIIDRKKNIFKLAQGEYVAAEKIENFLTKSLYIAQLFIYGNSYTTKLVAVVTPDKDKMVAHAIEAGWATTGTKLADVLAKPEVAAFLLNELKTYGKAAKLHGFEIPQAAFVETDINDLGQGFTIENDCLTPTFKLKRPQLLKRYLDKINVMYRELGENPEHQVP